MKKLVKKDYYKIMFNIYTFFKMKCIVVGDQIIMKRPEESRVIVSGNCSLCCSYVASMVSF